MSDCERCSARYVNTTYGCTRKYTAVESKGPQHQKTIGSIIWGEECTSVTILRSMIFFGLSSVHFNVFYFIRMELSPG